MSKKISLAYTLGLSREEDKVLISDDYNYSRSTLLRLRKILIYKKEANRNKQISELSYEIPAYSEKQADANGYQRALNEVINNLLPDPVGEEND